jgi:hypothetical protein
MPNFRYLLVSTACAAALGGGDRAQAGDQFKMLDGKQIQVRVVGQDITDGAHWSMYVRPDGALIGEESGSSWTGNWKVKDGRLCLKFPSSTTAECNEVWMSRALIRMRASRRRHSTPWSHPIDANDETIGRG